MRPRRTTVAGSNIELLSYASAKDANKMISVISDQRGLVAGDFVGDPSAAGHEYEFRRL